MFSRNMQMIYKRLMILGLLSMCLFVFGYLETTPGVSAARCIQDCVASEGTCDDSCMTACSAESTDEDCASCLQSCDTQFTRCMRGAVSCENSGPYPNSQCQVNFGQHCPVVGGVADCADPTAHYGYSEICNRSFGFQCIACPDHEICTTENLPPCL